MMFSFIQELNRCHTTKNLNELLMNSSVTCERKEIKEVAMGRRKTNSLGSKAISSDEIYEKIYGKIKTARQA